jgi:hypothetical protein
MCGSTSGAHLDGRRDQPPVQVDGLRGGRGGAGLDEPAAVDAQVGESVLAGHPGIAQDHVDHRAIIADVR